MKISRGKATLGIIISVIIIIAMMLSQQFLWIEKTL